MDTLGISGGVSALFDSVPGRTYRTFVSSDLGTWTDLGTLRSSDWPSAQTTISIDAARLPPDGQKKLFIRLSTDRTAP